MSPLASSLLRAAAAGLCAAGADGILRSVGDRSRVVRGRGAPRWIGRASRPFQILIYHRVRPGPSPFAIDAMEPEWFERQMGHLARHYRVLPLEELGRLARERKIPPRAVAVTFDDGYADNLEYALPILRRWGLPATLFVVTGCIGTGIVPWHDRVLRAFEHTTRRELLLPGEESALALGTEIERRAAAFRALALLKPLQEEARLERVARVGDALEVSREVTEAPGLMLDWEQVLALRRGGVAIGSHTVSHPILSRQAPERVWDELVESKRRIESAIGEPVTLFAYPNGRPEDYTPEVVSMVDRAGYRVGVTTSFGTNEADDDPLRWRRGTPWEADLPRFALKLAYYRFAGESGPPRAATAPGTSGEGAGGSSG